MHTRLRHLHRDERGMTFAFVAVGLMAFLAASTLAVDVGMFMTARSQAQNSADAGALAGAVALAFDDFDDRSAGGPAVQSAIAGALANQVMHDGVSVEPGDVTFPLGPGGANDRVRVDVYRTGERNNSIATLIGPIFGVPTVDIIAFATAEAAPANAMSCVKPFTIPDRWVENSVPPNGTFDRYDKKGDLLPNADVYIEPDKPGYVGYDSDADKGTPMMIRAGTGNNVAPSFYFSWAMPGGSGADWYRDNIAECNSALFSYGAQIVPEPGNMVGPTNQGVDDLIAKDPGATWDEGAKKVISDMHPSPRVFPIPLYDPEFYAAGKMNGKGATLRMANWVGFFITHRVGNDIYGRITPIKGVIDPNAGPAPAGAFPRAIRLVQ